MNFTREPIIETVITPREGCKLVVRSSKGREQEDYYVDAVEVVSFGHSFFFRSQERPKSFLVPVSDYEILELKETRMVLKNATTDRSIKIGGGRETPPRPREMSEDIALQESRPAPEKQQEKRRDNKRRRNRRGRDRYDEPRENQSGREAPAELKGPLPRRNICQKIPEESIAPSPLTENPPPPEEKAPSFISKLFPPPPTLIKESLSRYKPSETEEISEEREEEWIYDHPSESDKEQDEENEE